MTDGQGATGANDQPSPAAREAAARGLQEQFPGVRVWYGRATGSWWALVPLHSGTRLVEARGPQELRDAIVNVRGR